jgi:hypothetical protein
VTTLRATDANHDGFRLQARPRMRAGSAHGADGTLARRAPMRTGLGRAARLLDVAHRLHPRRLATGTGDRRARSDDECGSRRGPVDHTVDAATTALAADPAAASRPSERDLARAEADQPGGAHHRRRLLPGVRRRLRRVRRTHRHPVDVLAQWAIRRRLATAHACATSPHRCARSIPYPKCPRPWSGVLIR